MSEFTKVMIPVYGDLYLFRQPTGGHAMGVESFLNVIILTAKYCLWGLAVLVPLVVF